MKKGGSSYIRVNTVLSPRRAFLANDARGETQYSWGNSVNKANVTSVKKCNHNM